MSNITRNSLLVLLTVAIALPSHSLSQGARTGGMLQFALTYGIVKAKTKAVIPSAHAPAAINDS